MLGKLRKSPGTVLVDSSFLMRYIIQPFIQGAADDCHHCGRSARHRSAGTDAYDVGGNYGVLGYRVDGILP
ncbi:MAG: hypothetical protein K5669_05895 [Lachnospiraceae bacterium]|nr:hypothetical protein [Lachnospiraceae bacterium]